MSRRSSACSLPAAVVAQGARGGGEYGMSERFEQLVRASASSVSRRGILKMVGASAAAATAATLLRPFRGSAGIVCFNGFTPCGETCCPPDHVCTNASTGACACKAGLTPCADKCCPAGLICADANL